MERNALKFYDLRDLPGIFMDGDRLCDYLDTDDSILNDNFFSNFDWGVFECSKHYSKDYQLKNAHYEVMKSAPLHKNFNYSAPKARPLRHGKG